jgi:hypothetical protein
LKTYRFWEALRSIWWLSVSVLFYTHFSLFISVWNYSW